MKKLLITKSQIIDFLSSWNFMINTIWLILYSLVFLLIIIVIRSVALIEQYIDKDQLIVILFSILSIIIIHDARSYDKDQTL